MGDECVIDYVCEKCHAHHFHCCECGNLTLAHPGDEMCEHCFRGLVEISAVIRTIAYALPGADGDAALAAIKQHMPHRWPTNADKIIGFARRK